MLHTVFPAIISSQHDPGFSHPEPEMVIEVYGHSTYPLDFVLTNFGQIRLSGYTTFGQNLSVTYMLQLFTCTELERPPERRDHQSPKVTRLTSSRPRMAQSYTNAN
jgi:hypothetical protein